MFEQYVIGRQPILNNQSFVFGYELLFRLPGQNQATYSDSRSATARVLLNSLNNIGTENLLGRQVGFLNIDSGFIMHDMVSILNPTQFVLELEIRNVLSPALLAKIDAFRNEKYRFALTGITNDLDRVKLLRPLFDHVDLFKIDFQAVSRADCVKLVDMLKPFGRPIVAEKVESQDDYRIASSMGFDYFQGYFFSKPDIISSNSIEPAQLNILKLINMLDSDCEMEALVQEFRLSPELSISILKFLNSAAFFLRNEITSIRQALTLIGRVQLKRWLILFTYAGTSANPTASPLLETALVRAKSMEILSEKLRRDLNMAEMAFFTGLLSMMDAVFRMPMQKILENLNLSSEILDALIHRKGNMGRLLLMLENSDTMDRPHMVDEIMHDFGFSPQDLSRAKMQSIKWVATQIDTAV